MNNQRDSEPLEMGPGAPRGQADAPPGLPEQPSDAPPGVDPKYVQHLLDQAAYFNMLLLPDPREPNMPIPAPGDSGSVIGTYVSSLLHRFDVTEEVSTSETGLQATNTAGESLGQHSFRFLVIPDDYWALPSQAPTPTLLDPSSSQRFAMMDAVFKLGKQGEDGFYSFGTGRTFPATVDDYLQITAVGAVTEGFGKFKGVQGTYIMNGTLTPPDEFALQILIRIEDPAGHFLTTSSLPRLEPLPTFESDSTFFMFYASVDTNHPTRWHKSPAGQILGLDVTEALRLVFLDFGEGSRGLQSRWTLGPIVGVATSAVLFDLQDPASGTPESPIPYQTVEGVFTFFDQQGRVIGTFAGDTVEGREFRKPIPALPIPTLVFGGLGPIRNGTGVFSGVEGSLTLAAGGSIGPHVLSDLYVLRFDDPGGKFRSKLSNAIGRSALPMAEASHRRDSVTLELVNVTQGPPWPPAEIADRDGNFVLIHGFILKEVNGKVERVPNRGGVLVSKNTVPPLNKDGKEDFSNPLGAPYEIIRELDLSHGSRDWDIELYTSSCGPWTGDFGGGNPRVPRLGVSRYNLNSIAQLIQGLAPEGFQNPDFHVPSFPLHQTPVWHLDQIPPNIPIGVQAGGRTGDRTPEFRHHRPPITLRDYLRGRGHVQIELTHYDRAAGGFTSAQFLFSLEHLLPNSVYGVFAIRLGTLGGLRPPDPLAIPNTFVTDSAGCARVAYEIANPFPPPTDGQPDPRRIFILAVVYESRFQGWGASVGLIAPGVDHHGSLQANLADPSLSDLITREPST